jgi:hypothetical protein
MRPTNSIAETRCENRIPLFEVNLQTVALWARSRFEGLRSLADNANGIESINPMNVSVSQQRVNLLPKDAHRRSKSQPIATS